MRSRVYPKSRQRFVMYIPNNLREEIEVWVDKMGITMAEFGRDAFESYLSDKRREERNEELAETCKIFEDLNEELLNEWEEVETENWPV